MGTSQSFLELMTEAQDKAKVSEDRILEIASSIGDQGATKAQEQDLRAATIALEETAVDIFSLFEARMQHHFRRGPFSRKLKALLLDAGQTDLADRVHQYYLATNVLKHGTGASYRELLKNPQTLFVVKSSKGVDASDATTPPSLVDVSIPGFFDGLSSAIREAYDFLEDK